MITVLRDTQNQPYHLKIPAKYEVQLALQVQVEPHWVVTEKATVVHHPWNQDPIEYRKSEGEPEIIIPSILINHISRTQTPTHFFINLFSANNSCYGRIHNFFFTYNYMGIL